jgi:hypothetical protein
MIFAHLKPELKFEIIELPIYDVYYRNLTN